MEDNVRKRGCLLSVLGQIYICVAVFLNMGHLLSKSVQIRKKKPKANIRFDFFLKKASGTDSCHIL